MSGLSTPRAILLMGPTATGKTDFAMSLAERFPVEIVSVDSAQIYRQLNVGTAKPDTRMRERVPHHLIDILDPTEAYSAGEFCSDASRIVDQITQRGHIPLLVGGTMLYFHALRKGLSALPRADPEIRRQIYERARGRGWPALHAELASVDSVSASRIKTNDAQRIQRALEVFYVTGIALSTHLTEAPPPQHSHRLLPLALQPSNRKTLHERIARRFDEMLSNGLVEELAELRSKFFLHDRLNSMRCVGYRQAWEHLEGQISRDTLREKGIAATRQLAKRQITWLRSMADLNIFDPFATDILDAITSCIESNLS